jgi:predicted Zn-dependent protease
MIVSIGIYDPKRNTWCTHKSKIPPDIHASMSFNPLSITILEPITEKIIINNDSLHPLKVYIRNLDIAIKYWNDQGSWGRVQLSFDNTKDVEQWRFIFNNFRIQVIEKQLQNSELTMNLLYVEELSDTQLLNMLEEKINDSKFIKLVSLNNNIIKIEI